MDGWIDGQMDGQMDRQMDRWIDGQMDRDRDIGMYGNTSEPGLIGERFNSDGPQGQNYNLFDSPSETVWKCRTTTGSICKRKKHSNQDSRCAIRGVKGHT